MSNDTIPMKGCPNCGIEKPATTEFFYVRKQSLDGLCSRCKECAKRIAKEWAKNNPERVSENKRRYYQEKKDVLVEYSRNRYKEKGQQINQSLRNRYENDEDYRQKKLAEAKQYRQENIDVVRERDRVRGRKYRAENREETNARTRAWKKNNPDKVRAMTLLYNQANPEQRQARKARYESRKRGLPDTFTAQEWITCIAYFNGCCAVCGRQLKDLFGTHTAAADHWIPLSYEGEDNPGTVADNIIPLCHGENGCNNKKGSRLPADWLTEHYGKRKAQDILDRIETYFDWIRSQDE